MKKHDEKLDKRKLELSSFVTFLVGFTEAVIIYVISSFFELSAKTENVGMFYVFSYLIVLFLLLNLHKIARIIGKAFVFYLAVLIKIIVLALLVFFDTSNFGIALMVAYIISSAIEWVTLDVIVESFSKDSLSGRIRGLHLTILNIGFIFGPLISAYLMKNLGFHGIFIFVMVFNCFTLVFSLISFRDVNHRFEQYLSVRGLIRKILQRKNVMRIYYVSFVLEFFFAVMTIYIPIYFLDAGFSWAQIGKIFTIMLIPFVIVQYPIGLLADKKFGEKEMLIFSIIILGFFTLLAYFVESRSIVVWAAVLFATRVGAALLEVLRDSYFYKRVDGHDIDLINFFRTAMPAAYIFSAAIFSVFFFFFHNVKAAFILAGLVAFSALYPAIKLVDNKCEKELEKC